MVRWKPLGLALLIGAGAVPARAGESGTWRYVSRARGPKPYPEGRPWKWSDLAPRSIESANRGAPAWIKPPSGARHPVVLFAPARIPAIRARLARGMGPRIMAQLRDLAGKGKIAESGMYSLLTGDPSFARKAVPKLVARATHPPRERFLSRGSQIRDVALGYDLLYRYMSEEERDRVRTRLDTLARAMHLYKKWGRPLTHTHGNWLPYCWGALGIAGFALQEENRYAGSWILRARQANLLYLHNTYDPRGADFEAFSRYHAMGMDAVLICMAAERRQGRDFFTYRDNMFNRTVEFAAYMLRPDRRAWAPFDDAFVKGVNFPHIFAAIAGLTGDPLAQGMFEASARRPWLGNAVLAAAWYDPSVPVEKPQGSRRLSLARAYWGIPGRHQGEWSSGHVFMRTGFDSAEDILFAAQCGDTGGWHGHADQSGFYLYAYGDVLALDPAIIGKYHDPICEWTKGSEAHNIVLIDGQATPHYTVGAKLYFPERYYHAGEVDGFVHTKALDFVSMDFREGLALNPKIGKAARAKRYVVFFRHPRRRGYFVIVDDVIKDEAPRRYEWLLHPDREHKVVKEGPGRFAFSGAVDLKIRTIEPQDPVHRMATRKGYGVKYLRVRSREDRPRGLFLTILYPKKKGMTMPAVTEVREGGAIGARIGEDIVLFRPGSNGTIDAAGVKSDGEFVALRISGGAVTGAVVRGGNSLSLDGRRVPFEPTGR